MRGICTFSVSLYVLLEKELRYLKVNVFKIVKMLT